eukprot:2967879-Rhodomonas_salina.1
MGWWPVESRPSLQRVSDEAARGLTVLKALVCAGSVETGPGFVSLNWMQGVSAVWTVRWTGAPLAARCRPDSHVDWRWQQGA